MHAELSHYITVDVPMVCLSAASLYFALKLLQDYSNASRNYYLAAVFLALATTTKIPAVLLVIPLTLAHIFHLRNQNAPLRSYFLARPFWLAIGIFILIYIALTPGIVIHFNKEFALVLKILGLESGPGPELSQVIDAPAMSTKVNLFKYYATHIANSMTVPVFLVCLSGILWSLWRRTQTDIVLLSYLFAVYVIASISSDFDHIYPRYMLPVIPLLAVLGARFLCEAIKKLPVGHTATATIVLGVAFTLLPFYRIAAADIRMVKPDTRVIAREWIDQNIPSGSRVFIEGATLRPYEQTVPLQYSRENILAAIEHFKDSEPGKAKYFELELQVLSGNTYDLLTVHPYDLESVEYYKDKGIEYFILRPDEYLRSTKRVEWPAFVEAVRSDPEITLVRSFEPTSKSIRGPIIEIYENNRRRDTN